MSSYYQKKLVALFIILGIGVDNFFQTCLKISNFGTYPPMIKTIEKATSFKYL